MATEREIKFKISAEADGAERIQKLADQINVLAKSGGDASPEFKKLGAELDAIANQSALITQFAEVKNKTLEVKAAIADAAEATSKSAIALRDRTAELSKSTQAEKQSSDAVKESATAITAANVGIRAAKADIAAYNAAIATSGKANDEQTKGLAAANVELKQYKSELANAKSELDKVLPAQQQNAEALKQSQIELAKTSDAFDRNQASSAALKAEYRQSEAALQSIRDKMTAAGVSASELSTEYVKIAESVKKVANDFAAEKAALENKLAVQKATTDAIHASDEAYKLRVATLKADAQVETEIITLAKSQNQVTLETERNTLAVAKAKKDEKAVAESLASIRALEVNQTKLTAQGLRAEADAEELLINAKRDHLTATNRGTAATDAQIVAERLAANTKRELASATDLAAQRQQNFTTNTEKSGGVLSSLGGFAKSALLPIQALIATLAGATEFVRVNIELENIGRTLKVVTGSSEGAKKEIEFVKEASNRLGLELVSTAKAYSQFAAATKGSSLEGEQTRKIFEAVAKSMSLAGRSAAETEGALNALGQMVSKGVVQMEELRGQLGDRLPGAMKIAADSSGITTAQLIKMVESGQVLAKDLLPKLADGLNKTFTESGNSAKTTSQEFNIFRNAVTGAFKDIGDSGILKFLIWLGSAIGAVTAGFVGFASVMTSLVIGTFRLTIEVLTEIYDTLANKPWSTLLARIGNRFTDFGDRISDSAISGSESIKRFTESLFGMAGPSESAAASTSKLTASVVDNGVQAMITAKNWLGLEARYVELEKTLAASITTSEKAVEARKAEGEAIKQVAVYQGNVVAIRNAEIEAAGANSAALEEVAGQRQAELLVLEAQLKSQQEYLIVNKDESEEHAKVIDELVKKIASRKEEYERALAQAQASKLVTEAAISEGRALRDNSKDVEGLGAVYGLLKMQVDDLRAKKEAGIDVNEKLRESEIRLGSAARAYKDALDDQSKAIVGNLNVKQSENNLAQLTVKLAIEEARSNYEVAKAKGDEAGARRATNEMRRLEVQLAQLQAQVLRAEAEATLEMIKVKRLEAAARGDNSKATELELRAQELSAQAKQKQADISDEVAKRLDRLTRSTGDSADANDKHATSSRGAGTAMDGAAGSADNLANSYDRAASSANNLAKAQNTAQNIVGANKPKQADSTTSAFGQGSASTDNDIANLLYDFEHGRQVQQNPENLARARKAFEVANDNKEVMDKNPGVYDLDGQRSIIRSYNRAKALLDALSGGTFADSATQGNSNAGGLKTYTVNVTMGGASTPVNVASENDAQALLKLFGQLGVDKSRAN